MRALWKKLWPVGLYTLLVFILLLLSERVSRDLHISSAREAPSLPVLSPLPNMYARPVMVQIRPTQSRGQVVFTTDGTVPTATVGTRYIRPLRLETDFPGVSVLRAVEVVGGETGPVQSASYAVGLDTKLLILSIIAEPADLWDAERGLFTHISWRGDAWERPIHVTFFESGDSGFAVKAGLRMHGSEPLYAPKQSLRLYFRSEYEAARLTYPLFPGHPDQPERGQAYKRLLLQAGAHVPFWTLFRDQWVADLATALNLPTAQGRFVWLFVNGTSWGIYRLTERVDRFFVEHNYHMEVVDVVQEGNAREGTDEAWDTLLDWVAAHNIADSVHYAYLKSKIDLDNFTKFAILQQYFDFPADALFAVRVADARWFWVYGGGGQFGNDSDFALLFHALLQNPDYRVYFQAQLADLLNTVLKSEAVKAHGAQLLADLAVDFEQERARWPGVAPLDEAYTVLNALVDTRAAQLWARYAPQGTAWLRYTVTPPEAGRLYVNGRLLPRSDWRGRYALGTVVEAIAVPAPGYRPAGWWTESSAMSLTAAAALTFTSQVAGNQHYIARFVKSDDTNWLPDAVIISELWLNDNGTRYASLNYRPIEGDWIELWVRGPGAVDMRGWRLTDNDTKTATEEGSLIFPNIDVLAAVPPGTVILIVVTPNDANAITYPEDDVNLSDKCLIFYVGNGNLDVTTDPNFGLGVRDENLVLLAPGATDAFIDDMGVDFVAEGHKVTPYTFGVLADGVTWDVPFRYLGNDDGAFFTKRASNDDITEWRVDPNVCQSGDALYPDAINWVTPGAINPGMRWYDMPGLRSMLISYHQR